MNTHLHPNLFRLLLLLASLLPQAAQAQGTAFTYQGRLMESNAPANGTFEFEFSLYDRAAAGSNLGTLTLEETPVTNGLFTVVLDFGADPFSGGASRWLEIYARNDGAGGTGVLLTPRQRIFATPYAIMAGQAASATTATSATNLIGTLPAGQLAGQITALQLADGSITDQHVSPTAAIADTKLGTIATAGKVANSATTATSAISSNTIVMRNAAGSFQASTIQATAGFLGNGANISGLNAANIATGTLDDARLSANVTRLGSTIEPSELSKPYYAGTIDSASATELAFWRMTFDVVFPTPFAAVPKVTVALSEPDVAALDTLKVSVASKTTTGFTASAIIPTPRFSQRIQQFWETNYSGISAISVNGQPGVFHQRIEHYVATNAIFFSTIPSGSNFWQSHVIVSDVRINLDGMAGSMIQGRPAVVYSEGTNGAIRYVRAANAQGTAWGSPVTVVATANESAKPMLAEIGGRPAIVYNSGGLRYVRANDSAGTSWPAGVTVDTNGAAWPFLTVINGRPAITGSRFTVDLMYYRADDTIGASWSSQVVVQAYVPGGSSTRVQQGYYPCMTTINGNPAITYLRGPDYIDVDPYYIRATDPNGATWGEPRRLNYTSGYGRNWLVQLNGRPAVGLEAAGSPSFVHATDANGDAWGPVIDLNGDEAGGVPDYQNWSMQVLNGVPWMFFRLGEGNALHLNCIRATVPQFKIDWTAIAP
jgi:hypothetical protein